MWAPAHVVNRICNVSTVRQPTRIIPQRVAVEACLAGLFARREAWPLTELRSLLHNWTSRELDAALAALARDGQIVVEGGMVRPA